MNDEATNTPKVFQCRFRRIDDSAYANIRAKSYPIYEQWPCFRSCSTDSHEIDTLNLAQYYTAMRWCFGESGNFFDDWKGAFAFTFEVEVLKHGQTYQYGLHVINLRSTIEFRFCKVFAPNDKNINSDVYRKPIEDEFSAREMMIFDNFLYGYLYGRYKVFESCKIPSFFKTIPSNLITFGHFDGNFFEHQHETPEAFEADVAKYTPCNTDKALATDWPEDEKEDFVDVEVQFIPHAVKIDRFSNV